jgi:hypothetical protein
MNLNVLCKVDALFPLFREIWIDGSVGLARCTPTLTMQEVVIKDSSRKLCFISLRTNLADIYLCGSESTDEVHSVPRQKHSIVPQ